MDSKQLWEACLGELELNLSRASFVTWFRNSFIIEYHGDSLIVAVPNAFTKNWMEKKYQQKILKSLQSITDGKIHSVSFKVAPPSKRNQVVITAKNASESTKAKGKAKSARRRGKVAALPQRTALHAAKPASPPVKNGELSFRYTFDTFVVGKKTELAYAAARAVSEGTAKIYNPLFIYGGVGLGKTHLMQAIGNTIAMRSPDKRVLYAPTETFTNEYIKSVTMGQADTFKNKYRSVDVLLIDDIQFLAGKEGTQEAFFHTFNFLHQNEKQIVISSDRPPKAIPTLEDRLTSRFGWGMIVDVGAPDLETRIAILESKCKEREAALDSNVIQYIATAVQDNIRDLEGALNRVLAAMQLTNTEPTVDSVKGLLSSIVQGPKRGGAITPRHVISAVADYYAVTVDDLVGTSRKKDLVTPRQIAMYLIRHELSTSYPTIGHELGGRDHTTAMHAFNKIQVDCGSSEKLVQDINLIRQKLYI